MNYTNKEKSEKEISIYFTGGVSEEYPKHIVFKLRFLYVYATIAQGISDRLAMQKYRSSNPQTNLKKKKLNKKKNDCVYTDYVC